MHCPNRIFVVHNCWGCTGSIGSFCLPETVGRYIKYFSSLTAFRHIAVKVGLRVDSDTIGDLVSKDKEQSHNLWHWCLSSFRFFEHKMFYFLIKSSIWYADVWLAILPLVMKNIRTEGERNGNVNAFYTLSNST